MQCDDDGAVVVVTPLGMPFRGSLTWLARKRRLSDEFFFMIYRTTPKVKRSKKKKISEINIAKGKNVDRDRSRVFGYGCDWVQGQVCVGVDRCWWTWVECQNCFHLLASPRHTYIHTRNSAAISIAICPFLRFYFRHFSSTKFAFTVTSTTTFFTVFFYFLHFPTDSSKNGRCTFESLSVNIV